MSRPDYPLGGWHTRAPQPLHWSLRPPLVIQPERPGPMAARLGIALALIIGGVLAAVL